jgi:tRNA threonylcarbamoyladenosine biosynthesis protein TsaB
MLLAIDTATRIMSLALHDGESLLAEQSWYTRNRHTVELAPAVQKMLDALDMTVGDLTALGVSIGPGSYTGLRIGVAFAKGLATTRNLPLVGVTTLDTLAAAQPHYQSGAGLIAVVQAGRGRIIVNSYRWRKGQWVSRAEARLMSWEVLLDTIDGPAYVTGEIDPNGLAVITKTQQDGLPIFIAPPSYRLRRAGFLAQLAWQELTTNHGDPTAYSANKLLPVYLKSEPVP